MSNKGSTSKLKILNLQDIADINKACAKYLKDEIMEPSGFLLTSKMIEKELLEKDPDEVVSTKDICLACSRAFSNYLIKIIRELNGETTDIIEFHIQFSEEYSCICWNFVFLLRKSSNLIEVPKNITELIKDLIHVLQTKSDFQDLQSIFFVLINILNELIHSKKKKIDVRDSELVSQTFNILTDMLSNLVSTKKFFRLGNQIYSLRPYEKKISLFCNSNQDFIATDLIHFILLVIENSIKIDGSLSADFTKSYLYQVLDYLLQILDSNTSVLSIQTELAIEKYLIAINILRTCVNTSKIEISKNFLKGYSERIKNLFFHTVVSYCKYYFIVNGNDFEKDTGTLAKLYQILFDILSVTSINTEQEGFPILLLSTIIQAVILK
jgi:hypothetical protein